MYIQYKKKKKIKEPDTHTHTNSDKRKRKEGKKIGISSTRQASSHRAPKYR